MDVEKLENSPIGQLVKISGTDPRTGTYYSHFAFLPSNLPEDVHLDSATWNFVAQAASALGGLKQVCSQLPNPRLLILPALAREAVATSALEGTFAPLPEVMEARLPQFATPSGDVREILGYERMAEQAFEWIRERPITVGMVSDLQGVLMEFAKESPRDPGRVREHQVLIGPTNCRVDQARFIPPPPGDQLVAGMHAWQQWIAEEKALPPVVRVALAHYQFEALHPFGDGNGRVGRLVIVLQLVCSGELTEPALTISPWLLAHKDEYSELLLTTSQTGDWNAWVAFIARAIAEQCEAHIVVAEQLLEWCRVVRGELDRRRWGGAIRQIVDDLIDWPVVTMSFAAEKYDVSLPTAKHAIDRLVDINVLSEMTGRTYRRVFGAQDVIALVDRL